MNEKTSVGQAYLAAGRHRLTECVKKIKHCLAQLNDEQVWWRPHDSMNSIANIVLHLCGNLRQWIISGVGGEPDIRDRPKEFSDRSSIPKTELVRRLDEIVGKVDAVLAGVTDQQAATRIPPHSGIPGDGTVSNLRQPESFSGPHTGNRLHHPLAVGRCVQVRVGASEQGTRWPVGDGWRCLST